MNLRNHLTQAPAQNIGPVEAQQRIAQNPEIFLLDVRQPEEFRMGHIPGSQLIPLGELRARIKELPENQEIICICRSGNRSMTATNTLNTAGYQAVNLQGGMIAWTQLGFPVNQGR